MGSQQWSYLAQYPISDDAIIRDLLEEGVLDSLK